MPRIALENDMTEIAGTIDHTLLSPLTTSGQIERLCGEAGEWGFASVCIPPRYVPLAARCLSATPVAVGTVIGFPLGYVSTRVKIFEVGEAVAAGAGEIDLVISLGDALEGKFDQIEAEISGVVAVAGKAAVKVILECCYLDQSLKRQLAEMVVGSGARYVKTSTGFGTGGADLDDVRLLCEVASGRIGVKASGGIRDLAACRNFLAAGASRIGTSNGVAIMRQLRQKENP